MVDFDEIILIAYRPCRTGLNTHLTTDAAHLADGLDVFTKILGRTWNKNPGLHRLNFNDTLRTGTDAYPAADAFIRIDERKILHHIDGAKGAGLGTFPQTDTGVLTSRRSAETKVGSGTRGKTVVFVFMADPAFNPGATHNSDLVFNGGNLFAGQFRYPRRHLFLTGKTEIRRDIGIGDHGYGIPLAAGIAAATALGKRERFHHMLYQRIDFDGKFMGGYSQADAEEQTYATKQYQAT